MADMDPKDPGTAALVPTSRGETGISAPAAQTPVNHLVLNIFVPGLGSLVRGRRPLGAAQLGLALLALPALWVSGWLTLVMILGAYIWSIASGIGFLREANSGLVWR